jgi:hypothetical protein
MVEATPRKPCQARKVSDFQGLRQRRGRDSNPVAERGAELGFEVVALGI